MQRVVAQSPYCNDVDTCPQVLEVDGMTDDVLVQGYEDGAKLAEVAPPAGERIVRVPRAMLIDAGKRLERAALFDTFTHSAFRLETLPAYQFTPPSEERFRAFLDGHALPERTPDNSPWLAKIERATLSGRTWQRVHVIQAPLTDLMRFELVTDLENVAAGEDVGVADLDISPELATMVWSGDFWLLDGDTDHATALLMRYDDQGRFLDAERSTDPDILDRCRQQWLLAMVRSVPVADYLEQVGLQPAKVG